MISMEDLTPAQKQWLHSWNMKDIDTHHFLRALTHPSYHAIDPSAQDYERYEFLGDAVIELITTELIFSSEDSLTEGEMTRGRIKLVKNNYLSQIFDLIQLSEVIRTATPYIPTMKDKANFVEALFGAFFISRGYEVCKQFWEKINKDLDIPFETSMLSEEKIHPKIRDRKKDLENLYSNLELTPKDPITTLQELCLKNKTRLPRYTLVRRRGPDHLPVYIYEVTATPVPNIINQSFSAVGMGASKQKAKYIAASKFCELIFLPYVPE